MGMREYPSSGYTVELSRVLTLLHTEQPEVVAMLQTLIGEQDIDAIREYLGAHWPAEYPQFEDVYCLSDEDTPDDEHMEHGKFYLIFNEEDLFVKEPRIEFVRLKDQGIEPQFSRWSVWG